MSASVAPLPYHVAVADRLERLEPAAWGAFAEAVALGRPAPRGTVADAPLDGVGAGPDPLEIVLASRAERLDPAAHPRPHAAAWRAAAALALTVPVTIHQLQGGGRPNASLVFRPGEAMIAISGALLALLDDDELAAAFGHELAHYQLWAETGGRMVVADRLLDALALDPRSPPAYSETARRFDLATELAADRGSLLAGGSLEVALATLEKVATATHPDTALRARTLARWHADAADGDEAVATLLAPALDIERLDVLDRERLDAATRTLIEDALGFELFRTEVVVAHARRFFPDLGTELPPAPEPSPTAPTAPPAAPRAVPEPATAETLRYLAFVLLDLATVDSDLDETGLTAAMALATSVGLGPPFEEIARHELGVGERAWATIARRAEGAVPPARAPSG